MANGITASHAVCRFRERHTHRRTRFRHISDPTVFNFAAGTICHCMSHARSPHCGQRGLGRGRLGQGGIALASPMDAPRLLGKCFFFFVFPRLLCHGDSSALCFCQHSFTGITPEQSQALTDKAHVYLTQNGRISMAGLNTNNIRYFAENLDKAVRGQL